MDEVTYLMQKGVSDILKKLTLACSIIRPKDTQLF